MGILMGIYWSYSRLAWHTDQDSVQGPWQMSRVGMERLYGQEFPSVGIQPRKRGSEWWLNITCADQDTGREEMESLVVKMFERD